MVASGEPVWSKQCRETYVADEIGVLLGWTKMAAVARYETACRAADLPVVAEAWRAGLVDARKVAVIGEQVSYLDFRSAVSPGRSAAAKRSAMSPRLVGAGPGRSCGSGCAGR